MTLPILELKWYEVQVYCLDDFNLNVMAEIAPVFLLNVMGNPFYFSD